MKKVSVNKSSKGCSLHTIWLFRSFNIIVKRSMNTASGFADGFAFKAANGVSRDARGGARKTREKKG